MQTMTFQRKIDNKKFLLRIVEPGMRIASNMMSLCDVHEGEPLIEIFDTDHTIHNDYNGKALGYMIHRELVTPFIDRLEASDGKGINFSKDVGVPQWQFTATQVTRLLVKMKEVQATHDSELHSTPSMGM